MKKAALFLCATILFASNAFAKQCFIAKEDGKIEREIGDCNTKYSPCSTFKIPLSLIGFDSEIFIDEANPVWKFKEGYADKLDVWKQDQTPQSWMKYSCIWYSQVMTKELGAKKFQEYVNQFDYGNKDLSGDYGSMNGLTNSWLSSSLEISSHEQIEFLEKFLNRELGVSDHAYEMTKNLLFQEDLENGWKLYGKTGTGVLLSKDKKHKTKLQHGWFIGWIEKEGRIITFVNHIADEKPIEEIASFRAKADAKEKLLVLIYKL